MHIIAVNVPDYTCCVKEFVESLMDTTYGKQKFHLYFLANYSSFVSKNKVVAHINWELNQIDWKKYNGLQAFDAKDLYDIWTIGDSTFMHKMIVTLNLKFLDVNTPLKEEWWNAI
jgi:hypothetical protein